MSLLPEHAKEIVADQLVYDNVPSKAPMYRFRKLLPQAGVQQFSIPVSSQQEIVFEIPTLCANLSKSFLSFQVSVPATGVNNTFNWYPADFCSWIAQVQLFSRGGVYVCDIPYADKYSCIANRMNESVDAAESNDQSNFYVPLGTVSPITGAVTAFRTNGDAPDRPNEPLQAYSGNNNAVDTVKIQIPLSIYGDSILDLDKDIYWGETMVFRILLQQSNRVLWTAASSVNPSAAAAAYAGASLTLSQPAVYLACNTDAKQCQQLVELTKSGGFNFAISYPYHVKNVMNSGGAGNKLSITNRINRGWGESLVKCATSCWGSSETTNLLSDASNNNGSKITSVYSLLDSFRLQDMDLDCVGTSQTYEDWLHVKRSLRNRAAGGRSAYQSRWFLLDDFGAILPDSPLWDMRDNLKRGISVSDKEHRYDVYMTMAASAVYIFYTAFIMQKRVSFTSSGGLTVL